MRWLMSALVAHTWAAPALAADTYRVPVSAVPGSVLGQVSGIPLPTSLPFSVPLFDIGGGCSATGTWTAEIVNGGLEVELDLAANGSGCGGAAGVHLTFEMVIPELGGTVTMVRLNPLPLVTNFPVIDNARTSTNTAGGDGETSSVEGTFLMEFGSTTWAWHRGAPSYPTPPTERQRMVPLIPGDTVRFPFEASISMNDSSAFTGTLRMRYEFLVTVPEPSAALSLPIGALTLFGLASLRG